MTFSFFIVLLVINIVLMNLLIAIVGQKFEDVTSMNGRIKLYTRIKQIAKYTKKYDMILKLKERKNYLIFVNQTEKMDSKDQSETKVEFNSIRTYFSNQIS